ncbi:MAG: DUF86 domain-containing protein [Mycobacterium sp.]|nr:DUF86 domain-containing protein [Mycobacterium sp.]
MRCEQIGAGTSDGHSDRDRQGLYLSVIPEGRAFLLAILREIGIIGEAVNALPEGLTGQRPEIAWRQIGAMRNFLIHEYFNIDAAVVEDVIDNDLDPLSAAVKALLDKAKDA